MEKVTDLARSQLIAHSIGPNDIEILTWECDYPRYIHAEVMTHRMLSRNGRSSRAEPLSRVLRRAVEDPVEPLVWMYDAPRMGHGPLMDPGDAARAAAGWARARDSALQQAHEFLAIGMHRQYATRIVEPFLRIKMVITTTHPANLQALRLHPAPMPEIQQLVVRMARQQLASTPRRLKAGEWHLPYITAEEREHYPPELLVRVSTSRAGRLSYDSLAGKTVPIEEDLELHGRLVGATPKHASPAEHQAMATGDRNIRSGNFRGYVQYRHTIRDESVDDRTFDLAAHLVVYDGRDYIL